MEPELNINDLWKVWQWDEKVKKLLLLLPLEMLIVFNYNHSSLPFFLCQICSVLFFLHLPVDSAEDQETESDPAVSKDAVLPV